MTDLEWLEFQKLAAQLARACEIIDSADKIAAAVEAVLIFGPRSKWQKERLKQALDAFKVLRQGT